MLRRLSVSLKKLIMAYKCVGFVETVAENETAHRMISHINNLYQLQWPQQPNSNTIPHGTLASETSNNNTNNRPSTKMVQKHTGVNGESSSGVLGRHSAGLLIKSVVSLAATATSTEEKEEDTSAGKQQEKIGDEDKPDVSYFAMVAKAIQQSERGYVILNDIYNFVLKNYPYYLKAPPSWKISIRHQLSTNSCFVKVANVSGQRGFYWAIHPACKEELARGSYRTALQKVRHTTRRYFRGKRAGNRMHRYMSGTICKGSHAYVNKHSVPDLKPKVPDGYNLMQATPLPPNHPFHFLSRPDLPYESYVAKHNEQSWEQEAAIIKQDTCSCESQQQVLQELRGAGPSRIFTEFAQNHVMQCSSMFDDFM